MKWLLWLKHVWNNECTTCGSNLIDWRGVSSCPKCDFTPITFAITSAGIIDLFNMKRYLEENKPNSEELKVILTEIKRRSKQA